MDATTNDHHHPDPRPALASALDQIGRLIEGTDPSQGARPTPCDEWDVATLVDHLQAVVRRIAAVLDGQPVLVGAARPSSRPTGWPTGRRVGPRPTPCWPTTTTWTARSPCPGGRSPVPGAIGSYIGELTTHAWDLAVATGRTGELDEALALGALPAAMDKIPAEPRGEEIPFGPVVEVGPDATAYERLVAWEGRDPRWSPAG